MDDIIDFVSLSDEELKKLIGELTAEELEVSRQRRILHGQLDILRAELVLRLQHHREAGESIITAADVSRLSEILAGKHPATEVADDQLDDPTAAGD
jgi:hypothetical protein